MSKIDKDSPSLWGHAKSASKIAKEALTFRKRSVKERGIALLMTLMVVAMLSALSVQFSYNLRANYYMTGNLKAATQSYFHARSATKIALLAVNAKQNFPQVQQFLSLMGKGAAQRLEIWQRACDFVNIFSTGRAEFFGTNMLDFSGEDAVGAKSLIEGVPAFSCTVSAEDARVNVNRGATEAPVGLPGEPIADPQAAMAQNVEKQKQMGEQLLIQLLGLFEPMVEEGLFNNEDDAIELIMNIIDWTDADTSKSTLDPQKRFSQGNGPEPDYGRHGYHSKDARMDTVGEIQLVEGMTSDVYCRIRDKLTVFSSDKINVNDADLMVLKGVLCQSIQDELLRNQICLTPGLSGLPPMDDALLAMESCRNLKKQVYSTPFTSMLQFTRFFEQFAAAMETGVQLPISTNLLNDQLGVSTKMVRIDTEGIYGNTKRKMTTIVDTSTGALVHFHYE